MESSRRGFLTKTLGPGLLFAGAAIGVSHLVQSTRAGAVYGLGLVLVIIAANVFKYPAFSFGPWYAAATGRSLLEGYRRQGLWALIIYSVVTVGTMFTVLAAVTAVTAGLAKALFGVQNASLTVVSAIVIAVCAGILAVGKFRWLDLSMKVVVAALTVLTVVATILVLPRIDWASATLWPTAEQWNLDTARFVAPLVGWMPSAIDIAVWHSLWTLAKQRDTQHTSSLSGSLLDFNIGYVGSAILALCFVLLGAGVVYGTGETLQATAGGFAGQVIALYTRTLGDWSFYLIGSCAFAVMFSTTLTVVDGFPRALSTLIARFRGPEADGQERPESRPPYWAAMVILSLGGLFIIDNLARLNFPLLIDIATALAFLTAPVLAILNHRAVMDPSIAEDDRPGAKMMIYSLASIVLLAGVALWWLHVRFVAESGAS